MPLALGCLHATAQMVAVGAQPDADASPPTGYTESAGPDLRSTSLSSSSIASGTGGVQLPPPSKRHEERHFGPFSTMALAVTGSTLGPGVELATPLSGTMNLRLGGSYVNLQVPFSLGGVNYSTALKLTSGQGVVDWYPRRRGFHVSVGALYFRNAASAGETVNPGQQFELGGATYINSVDDPVQGTASLKFPRTVAPMVLMGFGNLIPRSGRHISVPFEVGGAYVGRPQIGLQLTGTACTTQGCFNTATDASTQANVAKEIDTLNQDLRLLQIYPIVSLGVALRF